MYSDYFNPRAEARGLLLIMDRSDDPVTPLLTQWTYQAAVHETFVLRNGRARVETPTLNTEIVLSHDQDSFYKANMFEPIWQVGPRVQELVQRYQGMGSQGSGFESIADMKRFIEDYPEYRKLGATIERHTTLLNELMKLSEQSGLRTVSAFEQELTASEKTADVSWAELMPLLGRSDLPHYHKLRLCMLTLCHVGLSRPLETLSALSFSDDDIAVRLGIEEGE
jgi:vacuolar protein sorting-associated protein 45